MKKELEWRNRSTRLKKSINKLTPAYPLLTSYDSSYPFIKVLHVKDNFAPSKMDRFNFCQIVCEILYLLSFACLSVSWLGKLDRFAC